MRQSGLGKGLSALIPSDSAARVREGHTGNGPQLLDIPVGEIAPNPNQPRQNFDEEALASLSASIAEIGVLQPILVRLAPVGAANNYELIAGERRWRASKRAGLRTIPAILREVSEESSVEQALVENMHRADLNPLEEAAAFVQLIEDFNMTHDQVAQRVGRSRVSVTNMIRLFNLPPVVQRMVRDGSLPAGHARAILGCPDKVMQEELARETVAQGLTVRAVEEKVRIIVNGPAVDLVAAEGPIGGNGRTGAGNGLTGVGNGRIDSADPGSSRKNSLSSRANRDPGLLEVENLLSEALSTSVSIEMGATRGKVVIDIADLADLDRVFNLIMADKQQLA